MPYGNIWDDERDAFLRQCRADGLTFSECQSAINRKFQVYYSRNACIGRAKRLGIGETMGEIRLRRSQIAVQREETKRIKREAREQRGLAKFKKPRRRGRNGLTFHAAPFNDMDMTGISPLKIACSPIPVGSTASRVVQTVKKIEQKRQQAERGFPVQSVTEEDTRPLRAADVTPLNIPFDDLKPHHCRWPYGGWLSSDPITFCGHPHCARRGTTDQLYCEAHTELSRGSGTYAERQADQVSAKDAA